MGSRVYDNLCFDMAIGDAVLGPTPLEFIAADTKKSVIMFVVKVILSLSRWNDPEPVDDDTVRM